MRPSLLPHCCFRWHQRVRAGNCHRNPRRRWGLLHWEDEIAMWGGNFLVFVFLQIAGNKIQCIVFFFFNGSSVSAATDVPDFLQGLDESDPDVKEILVEPDLLGKGMCWDVFHDSFGGWPIWAHSTSPQFCWCMYKWKDLCSACCGWPEKLRRGKLRDYKLRGERLWTLRRGGGNWKIHLCACSHSHPFQCSCMPSNSWT